MQNLVTRFARTLIVASLALSLGACFNDNHEKEIVFGNATIGQQLIDLKAAREAGALSEAEYRQARKGLILMLSRLDDAFDEDADKEAAESEDEFSWL